MRVDSLSHSFKAVAENELDDGLIYISRVEHTCERMAALVRCMHHAEVLHDGVKDGSSERVVAVPAAISAAADVEPWCLHSLLVPRQELARYWDKPACTCIRLAVPDHDDAPPQLDVSLADVPVLTDTTAGVDKHEHVAHCRHLVNAAPELVALSDGKGLLLVQLLRTVDVKVARVVFDDEVVPQGILVELLEQGADFLLCRVSAATAAHVVDD